MLKERLQDIVSLRFRPRVSKASGKTFAVVERGRNGGDLEGPIKALLEVAGL